jgi:hypothetical protein
MDKSRVQAQSPPPPAELLRTVCSTSYSAAQLHAATLAVLHSDSSGLMAYRLVMTTALYWETTSSRKAILAICPASSSRKPTHPHAQRLIPLILASRVFSSLSFAVDAGRLQTRYEGASFRSLFLLLLI